MLAALLAEPEPISYYALLQVDPVLKVGFRGGDPFHDALGRFTTPLGAVAHPVAHEENVAAGRAKPRSIAEAVEAGVPPPHPFGHAATDFRDGDYVYIFHADSDEPLMFGRVVGRRRGERAYGRVHVYTRHGYSTHPVHAVAPAEELERYAEHQDDLDELAAWHVYHFGPEERHRFGVHEYRVRRAEWEWHRPEALPSDELARQYTRLTDLEREGRASAAQRFHLGRVERELRSRGLPVPKVEEWRQFEEDLARHPVEGLTREELTREHARLRDLVRRNQATWPERTRLRVLEDEFRQRRIRIPTEPERPAPIDQTLARELANLREPETIYRMDPDDPIEPYLPFIQGHLNRAFSNPDFTIEHLFAGKDADRISELHDKAAQREWAIAAMIGDEAPTEEEERLQQGAHFMTRALRSTKAAASYARPHNHQVLVALKNGEPVAALNFVQLENAMDVGLLGSAQGQPGAATALQWALANWAHMHQAAVESEALPSAEPYHAKIGRILDNGHSTWTPEDVTQIAKLRPEQLHPEQQATLPEYLRL